MLKPHIRLYLIGFITDFAIMMAITVVPFYIYNQLHEGAWMSGLFGGLQAVLYAITCLVTSQWVQKTEHGMRWAYVGILIYMAFVPVMVLVRNVWLCGFLSVIGFGALAMVWPAFYSWMGADPDTERRQKRLGIFNLAWSSGFAFSPLFAGPLYDIDYRLPFFVVFLLSGVSFLLIYSLPKETEYFGVDASSEGDEETAVDVASEVYLYAAWMATLVANLLLGVTRNVFPKRLNDLVDSGQLRLFFEAVPPDFLTTAAATKFSWLSFACSLTTAALFLLFGRTTIWRHNLYWLVGIQLAAGIGFWVLGHTNSLAVMAVCFMLAGASLGVAFFSSVYYSVANPAHKHRRAAINEGAVGVGGFLGSIAFGYLTEHQGMDFPFRWTPLFVVIAIALQYGLVCYRKKQWRA